MAIKGTLVLLRHGQTDYNVRHLMTGQRDVPLNANGEEQAREAGRIISVFHFDKVYSSTLSRAFNTAAAALKEAGNQQHLQTEAGWAIEQRREVAELDTGVFTGRSHKTDPEIAAFERRYDRPLPGGESDMQVVERVQKFYEDELLPRLARGETVLVVSHSGTMRAFAHVLGIEDTPPPGGMAKKIRIPNATPTVVEYEDGAMTNHYRLENPKEREAANQNKPPVPPQNAAKPGM